MYQREIVISEFNWSYCVVLAMAITGIGYCLFNAFRVLRGFHLWFRNRGELRLLPTPIKKMAIYNLIFWGGLGLGGSWVFGNFGRDLFFSYEQVNCDKQGVILKYFGFMPDETITWDNIKTFKVKKMGQTSSRLEIERTDGALYDSCPGNIVILSQITHELESHGIQEQ